MSTALNPSAPPDAPIRPDDPSRKLAITRPQEDPSVPRVGIVGDTYTILLTGQQTDGRFCLIDMQVPPGGGPAPHRHDFEESFTLLEGEISVTFRGETLAVRAGETINIPSNAPHAFRNASDRPARMFCVCAPAGQDEFFLAIGQHLAPGSDATPLDDAEQQAFIAKATALALRYRTELLGP